MARIVLDVKGAEFHSRARCIYSRFFASRHKVVWEVAIWVLSSFLIFSFLFSQCDMDMDKEFAVWLYYDLLSSSSACCLCL